MKTLLATLLIIPIGSSSATAAEPKTDKPKTATCHVCRYNRDLACVEFRLKSNTPQLVHNGQRYCFCSEECRKAFAEKPAKYVPKG